LILGAWLLFIIYGCMLCLIIRETSPKPASQANSETSLVSIISDITWQSEVITKLDTLPLNGFKPEIVEIVNDFESPVQFIETLGTELKDMIIESGSRKMPFGSGFKNGKRGTVSRPYKGLAFKVLNDKIATYQQVYETLMQSDYNYLDYVEVC
jgi:hypothetical protein